MVRRFLYLFLVFILAFGVVSYVSASQINWLLWTALFFTFLTPGIKISQKIAILSLTAFGVAVFSFFAGALAKITLIASLYLLGMVFFFTFLSERYPRYAVLFFITNLMVVFAYLFPVSYAESLMRAEAIFAGGLISAFSYLIIWPYFFRAELKSSFTLALKELRQLNQDIFACFLEANYPTHLYLYERRIHLRKNSFLQSLNELEKLAKIAGSKITLEEENQLKTLLFKLTNLYEIMLDVASLRFRVTDHTIFEVCKREMLTLFTELDQSFMHLKKLMSKKASQKPTLYILEKLEPLENTYQQVMQVTAREPLVFILFFFSLKNLSKSLEDFALLGEKFKKEVL